MGRSKILLATLISFCVGIALHPYLEYQADLIWQFFLISIVTSFLLFKHKKLFLTSLILCSLSLGIYRGQSTLHIPSAETVDYYASEERNQITLVGSIVEEPDVRRNKTNYNLAVSSANDNKVSGYTLISTSKYPAYAYGDTLEVSGHLQKPTQFDSFDYAGYLSRFGIYSVMYRPRVKLLEHSKSKTQSPKAVFFSGMLKIKQHFEHQMNRTLATEPSASFMAGLLLGSRKGLPEKLSEDFRITGLTHIIAISGYNITLIVSILMALFRPLGKRTSIILAGAGIILFTLFVGASPAVVRACIMGLIALIALNSDRKGDITLTLVLTACLMIGYNPKILVHDVGFQLSFLATMGLIYVSPLLEPYFQWLPEKLAIRESILLTLSAQIMALPIILYNFNNLSIVSPLSNLLIAGPIIPLAMLFGFVGSITSFIWLPLAKLIAYPAYLLLAYIVWITGLTARIPYASVEVLWFNKAIFIIYFIGLTSFLIFFWKQRHHCETRIKHLQLQYQQLISHKAYEMA